MFFTQFLGLYQQQAIDLFGKIINGFENKFDKELEMNGKLS